MHGTYDVCVVLGEHFEKNWALSQDLKDRLNKAADLYQNGTAKKIIACGKWTIWYDWLHVQPPVTEAMLMKRYLQKLAIPKNDILCESRSKDTVGNAYFTKQLIRKHPRFKDILVLCASQDEPRVQYLFHKFFGDDYTISFLTMHAQRYTQSSLGAGEELLAEEQKLLEHVRDGHEEDMKQRLYTLPYYRKQAMAVENRSHKRLANVARISLQ